MNFISLNMLIENNTETSSETSSELKARGLVVRYGSMEYRDQIINFLSDPMGVQCVAQWNNQIVDLGLNNIYYKEDMCRFIDRVLDLITEFPDEPRLVGAKLEYFHNSDFRDIRLIYKGRILKVFLVAGNHVNETFLISESRNILYNSGLLEPIDKLEFNC